MLNFFLVGLRIERGEAGLEDSYFLDSEDSRGNEIENNDKKMDIIAL